MLSLFVLLLVNAEPDSRTVHSAEQAKLCLTLVLEKDHYWLAGSSSAMDPEPYTKLESQLQGVREAFPNQREIILAKGADVSPDWLADAQFVARRSGFRKATVRPNSRLAALKQKNAEPKDLAAAVREECSAAWAQDAFRELYGQVAPLPVFEISGKQELTKGDATRATNLCAMASNLPQDMIANALASECAGIASCAQSCAGELRTWSSSSQPSALRTCADFTSARSLCSPLGEDICARRWVLALASRFVERASALAPDLATDCSVLQKKTEP